MRAGGAPVRAARSRPPNAGNFFFLISFSLSGAFTFCASGKIKRCKILMRWHRLFETAPQMRAKKIPQTKVCGILEIVSF